MRRENFSDGFFSSFGDESERQNIQLAPQRDSQNSGMRVGGECLEDVGKPNDSILF